MAAALGAAHDAGVVHRDFKSSNVVIMPSRGDQHTTRVVVTDFGLARRTLAADAPVPDMSGTGSGQLMGTPAYMSPEQVQGLDVTAAADIYALGIVMFEMVTGALPFDADTPLASAIKRLQHPPASPRSLVAGLDDHWEGAILRALERQPADRFPTALDLANALDGGRVAPSRRQQRRRRTVAAALVLLLLTGGGLAWWSRQESARTGAGVGNLVPRRAVAVLGFKNLSGEADADWLSTALSEMLMSELAAGDMLRIIPGESVARMKIDLALADADSFASDTLARIRRSVGSDLLVLGSYVVVADRVRLDLRVQDAAAGSVVVAMTESAPSADLFDLVSRVGTRLRTHLGIGGLSAAETRMVRASLPSSPEAARLYAEGLARLRRLEASAARDILQAAAAADPQQPLVHSALAAAWRALGYDARARESARRAFELAGRLSRDMQLWVEGQYREVNNEREKAVQAYSTLFNFFPDDVEYGLRLAGALTAAGRAKDALATLDSLRRLPAPASDDPSIDLADAAAAAALPDFGRQRMSAARAAEKGRALSARLVVARGALFECNALGNLGEPKAALERCEESRRLFAEAGDGAGAARASSGAATVLRQQGDVAEAVGMYEQALATYRRIGDQSGVATVLNNSANALRQLGDVPGAQARYDESLAIYREIDDRSGTARVLHNMGIVRRQQGRLDAALKLYEEALTLRRELGEKDGIASTQATMANVFIDMGDLTGARRMLEGALATWRELGEKRSIAVALSNLAFVRWQLGELTAARQAYEESLLLARELGDRQGIARALNNLADVHIGQGDLVASRAMYEEALKVFGEIGEQRGLAYVHGGLGRLLLTQDRLKESRLEHEAAAAIWQKIGAKGTMAESRVSLAEVAIEEGRARDAERLAAPAAEQLAAERMFNPAAIAYAVLARARLSQDRAADARVAIDRLTDLLPRIQNRQILMSTAIDTARVHAALGASDRALALLEETLEEANARGFVETQLQTRLALGEVEVRMGRIAAGRARRSAVEEDASTRGFLLIARKAAAAGR
jgi:tetratricopeptide (TPR) repeat protein